MRSASPISSAHAADSSADWTIASRITARASSGFGKTALSSIRCVSNSWSREPQLAPIRTHLPWRSPFRRSVRTAGRAFAKTDVAGIDAIFVERFGASGMIREKFMADVMEVSD